MRWRACYSDGADLWDGPGAYPTIDRSRLERFEVYGEGSVPLLAVDVHGRLVYRLRRWARTDGTQGSAVLVACEAQDRSEVDLWVITPGERGATLRCQQGYGDDVFTAPPELQEEER